MFRYFEVVIHRMAIKMHDDIYVVVSCGAGGIIIPGAGPFGPPIKKPGTGPVGAIIPPGIMVIPMGNGIGGGRGIGGIGAAAFAPSADFGAGTGSFCEADGAGGCFGNGAARGAACGSTACFTSRFPRLAGTSETFCSLSKPAQLALSLK